jgi:hypothetical protein
MLPNSLPVEPSPYEGPLSEKRGAVQAGRGPNAA